MGKGGHSEPWGMPQVGSLKPQGSHVFNDGRRARWSGRETFMLGGAWKDGRRALNVTLRSSAFIPSFPGGLGIRGVGAQLWNSLSIVISAACQVVYLVQFTGRALLSIEKSLAPCESNHHGRHTSKREHTAASEKPAPHSGTSVHEYAFPTSDAAA